MIKEGTVFTFKYLYNGFIQTKRIATTEELEVIKTNKGIWKDIVDYKEKKRFEENNKIGLNPDEVHPQSALGLAVIGSFESDTRLVISPSSDQGSDFQVKIIKTSS